MQKDEKIRVFKTGATRDLNTNKPEYFKYFHPLVMKRYGEYMMKHQFLANGEKRDADNWQKGFGETAQEHLNTCLESKNRHDQDLELHHTGYGLLAVESLEDSLCAIMFNTQAYLYKLLEEKNKNHE